jgi:MFS family permease
MSNQNRVLPIIVFAQFCCTSLWFAGNAVMSDLVDAFSLDSGALGHLTSAVQFGFIFGTLIFAIFTIADRFATSQVFFVSAILGALFNLGTTLDNNTFTSLLFFRFMTGFFLAGIYPVGMKIAADYFQKGLGKSLGYLVGALVLGTAFPHLLKGMGTDLPWKLILWITSGLASFGGLLMLALVPNGPFRKQSMKVDFSTFFQVFKNQKFRSAAFGYFGHMWELYAFWAFVPMMISTYLELNSNEEMNISLFSFLIIALGGVACVIGGYLSIKFGTKKTGFAALLMSCILCLFSPVIFYFSSKIFLIFYLIIWGLLVIADSPLFSTLVAQNAIAESKGTALTIVNSIGFFISIFSIQLLTILTNSMDPRFIYIFLAIGPIVGLIALSKSTSETPASEVW